MEALTSQDILWGPYNAVSASSGWNRLLLWPPHSSSSFSGKWQKSSHPEIFCSHVHAFETAIPVCYRSSGSLSKERALDCCPCSESLSMVRTGINSAAPRREHTSWHTCYSNSSRSFLLQVVFFFSTDICPQIFFQESLLNYIHKHFILCLWESESQNMDGQLSSCCSFSPRKATCLHLMQMQDSTSSSRKINIHRYCRSLWNLLCPISLELCRCQPYLKSPSNVSHYMIQQNVPDYFSSL